MGERIEVAFVFGVWVMNCSKCLKGFMARPNQISHCPQCNRGYKFVIDVIFSGGTVEEVKDGD